MFSLAKIRGKTETAKQFGVFDMLFEEVYDSMRMQRIFHPSSSASPPIPAARRCISSAASRSTYNIYIM